MNYIKPKQGTTIQNKMKKEKETKVLQGNKL